jgi:cell division septation protein DedD
MHTKKVGFLCLWARNVPPILKKLSRGALIFPILLCISCASYNIASREGRTAETLNDPKQGPSFKYISYAQAMREKLEDKGYGSYITVSGFDEEKRIFRVLIGRFTNVKQAQRLAKEIWEKENLDVIVALKPPRDKFVVQAGCFTEMAQAKELRKKLADYGHNAYITLSVKGIDKQYNVLLGEFLNRAEAERVSEEIGKKENIQVFVNTI